MDPTTIQDWLQVANERAADADAMMPHRPSSVGPGYIAGYAVECTLKAYLQRLNTPYPTSGRAGHDLRGLWNASRLRVADLGDRHGEKAFYLHSWTTDLRYET